MLYSFATMTIPTNGRFQVTGFRFQLLRREGRDAATHAEQLKPKTYNPTVLPVEGNMRSDPEREAEHSENAGAVKGKSDLPVKLHRLTCAPHSSTTMPCP